MGDEISATPALSGGRVYVLTRVAVYSFSASRSAARAARIRAKAFFIEFLFLHYRTADEFRIGKN